MHHLDLDHLDDGFYESVWQPGDALWRLPLWLFPERRWVYVTSFPLMGRRVALLSSRTGRQIARWSAWFEQLGCLLRQLAGSYRVVLNCPPATCHRYLEPAQGRIGFELVPCCLPAGGQTAADWVDRLGAGRLPLAPPLAPWLAVSPQLGPCPLAAKAVAELPLADRLLAALGEDVYVLFVRAGGQIEQLVDHVLAHPTTRSQRWVLAACPDFVPTACLDRWLRNGAVAWYLGQAADDPVEVGPAATRSDLVLPRAPIIPLSAVAADRYLAHWTRAQPGPWPDQTETDYVCSLLFDRAERDRSALASLRRILWMQRLLATNRLTRAAEKVVCLTDRPVSEFAARRVFRAAHTRWDFETLGLCIDRHWLTHRGARRVIYGDDLTWQQLADVDRPFFQCLGGQAIDWTQEREWRHVGDLDLTPLDADQALVFVPDMATAEQIVHVSRWPVTIV